MSFFQEIPLLPPDPILSLPAAFAADKRPFKVNLGVGTYQTSEGQPFVLNCVQEAERRLLNQHLDKEYLPIEGDKKFLSAVKPLLFGSGSPFVQSDKALFFQTLGGTGALRVGGEFLARFISQVVFIPDPTWPNHANIFKRCGLKVETYPYLDSKHQFFNFEGLCQAINKMPPASVLVLHGCCHNPTGCDPTFEQWKALSALIKERRILPFFDLAYQGFGDGLDQDAQAIRYFASQGHEMLVAYSFAKNLGIYGERAGFLCVLLGEGVDSAAVASQVKSAIRGSYSNPPLHAARIVETILTSPDLYQEWQNELENMRIRIQEMRRTLRAALLIHHDQDDYSHMNNQKGLFFLCDLTPEQVQKLKEDHAIYMMGNGRINLAGLNSYNMDYVAQALGAIAKTSSNTKKT